jgi:hypothetical protein
VFRESIANLVGEAITREYNDSVVVQGNLLRDLCRVLLVRGDCAW